MSNSRGRRKALHISTTSVQPPPINIFTQELNKHGKYQQVNNLNKKYKDKDFQNSKQFKQKIQIEFHFAKTQLQKISQKTVSTLGAILLNFFLKYGARIFIFLYLMFSSFQIQDADWSRVKLFIKLSFERGMCKTVQSIKKDFDQAIKQMNEKWYEFTDQNPVYEVIKPEDIQQNLTNVVGIDECKKQVEQIIKFIKEKQLYLQKGAKLPKGILLHGDPGVGKTLLARAIAKQSNVKFIYQNGSAFDQIYVGSGSRRIRQLFAKARQLQPCIIFIDQIDSLLSKTRRYNESSSSRSVVNGFLSQLDGFKQSQNIVLIGATNHLDMIDQAAQRAGRMDMKIYIPKPDQKGRADLYKLFLNKLTDIQFSVVKPQFLAKITPGFTGAEIKNLVNTAVCDRTHKMLKDANQSAKFIGPVNLQDLIQARDKILMGIERKTLSMSDVQRLNTAIHQTGHTLTALLTKGANIVEKVTIVPRSQALGVTLMMPDQSQERTLNKQSLIAMIDVAMGGHIAEKIFIGDEEITSGCSSDLSKATEYAKMAVRQYGMFSRNKIGFISSQQDDVSQNFNSNIDDCVRQILNQSAERVHSLLMKNKKNLMDVSKLLYLNDTLSKDEVTQIMKFNQMKVKGHFSRLKEKRKWTNQLDRKYDDIKKRLEPKKAQKVIKLMEEKKKNKEVEVKKDQFVETKLDEKEKEDEVTNQIANEEKEQQIVEEQGKKQDIQQPAKDLTQKNLFNPAEKRI